MKSNAYPCIDLVRKDEGDQYTNTPGDNGGPTKYGITLNDVRLHIKSDATAQDVKSLTWDQARTIYKTKYWDALNCDNLPSGVDYSCFDYSVNSGLGRPRKALQRFKSLQGAQLINAINDERTAFLKAIGVGHNAKFLNGWLARVNRVRTHSLELAKDKSSGPTAAVATASIGAVLSQYWHNHMYIILGSAVVAAVVIGYIVHKLRNKHA